MLLPIDIDYLARQERIKDLIREAERVRLIRAIGHQYSSERKTYRRLVGWVGAQMIKVGQHLQGYSCPSRENKLQDRARNPGVN